MLPCKVACASMHEPSNEPHTVGKTICGGGSEETHDGNASPSGNTTLHGQYVSSLKVLNSQRAAQAYLATYDKNPGRAVAMNMRSLRLLQRL